MISVDHTVVSVDHTAVSVDHNNYGLCGRKATLNLWFSSIRDDTSAICEPQNKSYEQIRAG